jgi:hypothetical protein
VILMYYVLVMFLLWHGAVVERCTIIFSVDLSAADGCPGAWYSRQLC